MSKPGMIFDHIIDDLTNCEIVIADLTELNANVFYELGIRHCAKKPVIYIGLPNTTLPFDNAGCRTIFKDFTKWQGILEAREGIVSAVREIENETYKVSNPVIRAKSVRVILP